MEYFVINHATSMGNKAGSVTPCAFRDALSLPRKGLKRKSRRLCRRQSRGIGAESPVSGGGPEGAGAGNAPGFRIGNRKTTF